MNSFLVTKCVRQLRKIYIGASESINKFNYVQVQTILIKLT